MITKHKLLGFLFFQLILLQLVCKPVLSATASTQTGMLTSKYQLALNYFNNGDIELAIKIWEGMLENNGPSLTEAQQTALKKRLAFARTKLNESLVTRQPANEMEFAIQEFHRARRMSESPTNASKAPEQFERVLKLLYKAREKGLSDKRIDYYEAYCLVALNRLDEAPSLLDTAIENEPHSPEPVNLLADYLKKIDNGPQRILTLKRSLKLDPNQPDIELELIKALIATKSRKKIKEAGYIAIKSVKGSKIRAQQLANLFPKSPYKNKLERIATEIAIQAEKKRLREAIEASGRTYTGPKLKVLGGTASGGTGGNTGGNSESGAGGENSGGNGGQPPAGPGSGAGPPPPAPE